MAVKTAAEHAKFLVTELLKYKVKALRNAQKVSKVEGGAKVTDANFAFSPEEVEVVDVLTGVVSMSEHFANSVNTSPKKKSSKAKSKKPAEVAVTAEVPAVAETPVVAQ